MAESYVQNVGFVETQKCDWSAIAPARSKNQESVLGNLRPLAAVVAESFS